MSYPKLGKLRAEILWIYLNLSTEDSFLTYVLEDFFPVILELILIYRSFFELVPSYIVKFILSYLISTLSLIGLSLWKSLKRKTCAEEIFNSIQKSFLLQKKK